MLCQSSKLRRNNKTVQIYPALIKTFKNDTTVMKLETFDSISYGINEVWVKYLQSRISFQHINSGIWWYSKLRLHSLLATAYAENHSQNKQLKVLLSQEHCSFRVSNVCLMYFMLIYIYFILT